MKKKIKKITLTLLTIALIGGIYFYFSGKQTSAAWWNDSWHYRKSIQITNNASEETNVYVETTIDTSDTTKFQADCGDLRFTKYIGEELPYYIVSGCGTATTTVHINFETFEAGTQTIFYYYGNPTADNGFAISDFSAEASDYTIGAVGNEEIGGGPAGYWSFNEGYGATAHDESSSGNDGNITGATWKDESECIAGKCLGFDGSDDRLAISNFQFPISNQFSITQFINVQTLAIGDPIISQWGGSQNNILAKLDDTNSDELKICVASGLTDDCVNYGTTSALNLEANKWYNLQIIYDGTQGTNAEKLKVYIDGAQKSLSFGGTIPATIQNGSTADLEVGGNSNLATYLNARIDEVKIYPYARTDDQIKQDYNAGLAGQSSSKGTAASFGSKSDSWLSDGLVGHWKMDEASWNGTAGEVVDASGNGNNGTATGNASTTVGKFGKGGVFDGTDDYVDLDSPDSLDNMATFTFSIWMNTDDTGAQSPVIEKGSGSSRRKSFYIGPVDGGTPGRVYAIVDTDGTNAYSESVSSTLTADEWGYWTIMYDDGGDRMIHIYKDGEEVNYLTQTPATGNLVDDSSNEIWLGSTPGTMFYDLTAQIDEVRVYNRALSQDEVKKLYEYAPGPVLHLKMDEKVSGDFKTLYDISGNGNNGTTYGATAAGLNCAVQGKLGGACSFSGALGDYVDCGTSASLEVQEHTFSAWVYPNSVDYAATGIIAAKATNINNGGVEWGIDGSDLRFAYNDGAVRGWYIATNSNLTINEWQYITISWDSSAGEVNFYVNGIKTDTVITTTGTIVYAGDMFKIDRQGSNNNFNGKIDDLKIYNYVRTQKQILADYAGEASSRQGGLGKPVLDLDFDEGFGATAHNKGIGGAILDGTLTPGAGGTNTTATQMWSLSGKNGKAMEFDGTDDYVDLGDESQFEYGGIFSVSAWIKTSDANSSEIISKGGISDNWEFVVHKDVAGEIVFQVNECDGDPYLIYTTSGLSINDNEWHHIIGIADTSVLKIYVDGNYIGEDNTPALNPACTGGTSPLRVGYGTYTRNDWAGLIDEVKIYNYALTEDDIKTVYNSGVSAVMGSSGTDSATGGASNAASGEYCVPGDTSNCDAPVLHLKMDEKVSGDAKTLYDISGNGNNGTTVDGANNTGMDCSVRGKYGSGCEFDGADDYVGITQSSSLNNLTSFTYSTWVKADEDSGAQNPIIEKGGGSSQRKSMYLTSSIGSNSRRLIFLVDTDGTNAQSASAYYSYTVGQWEHWTATYDDAGDRIVRIYKNGQEVSYSSQVAGTGNLVDDSTLNFAIGATPSTQFYRFTGQIDDARIYNYVRTPAQIAWDYNHGKPIAEWRMDEASGLTAHNSISNSLHATLVNMEDGDWVSGKLNNALDFDGSDEYADIGDTNLNINSIGFWINADADTDSIIDLDGGTHTISVSGGTISANGFSSPTIYVDGAQSSTITAGAWHHIFVKTGTAFEASNMDIGRIAGGYFGGLLDEVKIFNYALTSLQIKNEYNGGALRFGE